MKRFALAVLLLVASIFPAAAQTYYDIDVDLPSYPEMQPVPDSPVYYAPNVDSNYFYYDGMYWDYYNDAWYSSAWYNGPWEVVDPVYIPTYILWVPIRFYRRPPPFFRAWHPGRAPRWSEHWGRNWLDRHNSVYGGRSGRAPPPAPLPQYQRQYPRDNYPHGAQQYALHGQRYSYQPREQVVRQHYQNRGITAQQQHQPLQREGRRDEGPREQRR